MTEGFSQKKKGTIAITTDEGEVIVIANVVDLELNIKHVGPSGYLEGYDINISATKKFSEAEIEENYKEYLRSFLGGV